MRASPEAEANHRPPAAMTRACRMSDPGKISEFWQKRRATEERDTLSGMRLFIGIPLAPSVTDALMRIREQFASVSSQLRWSLPESWHVTLQFLGRTDEQQQTCVVRNLKAISASPLLVRISALDFFDRVGVFFAGVVMTPELLALQQRVTAATHPCGFAPEARVYHPHITFARSKGRAGGHVFAPLKRALEHARIVLDAEFTTEEFILYESFPGPEGSRYEVRARFPLRG